MPNDPDSEGQALPGLRPLSLPEVLWQELSSHEQDTYRLADVILQRMVDIERDTRQSAERDRQVRWIDEIAEGGPRLFSALRLLDRFGLVSVQRDGRMLKLGLIATPEGHVRVTRPGGGEHWVFIARPIREPELDPKRLN